MLLLLQMRLVHIRLRRWTCAGAFVRVFWREIVRNHLAVVVTIWLLLRLITKLHSLEDKIVVVELEWSAANSENSCIGNRSNGRNLVKRDRIWCFNFTCWNQNAQAAYLLIFPLLLSHEDESGAEIQQQSDDNVTDRMKRRLFIHCSEVCLWINQGS